MRLIDTSVAVDHLRGYQPATRLLDELITDHVALVSSEVVRFELLAGVKPVDEPAVERFLEAIDWVPVAEPVAHRAAAYARAYRAIHSGIDDADCLIAATAALLDAPLLTTNVRHFPTIEGLERPY